MCGIAGYLSVPGDPERPGPDQALLAAIRYRGRDAEGRWSDGRATLLHARLSIIDLQSGNQPMEDHESRLVITFNGEIYNYLELRREYEAAGARFRTQSDTEVILEGYKLKGARVCADLNGMFAFAIWDKHQGELFLARDRMGKKPLFWCALEGQFYFASTINGFRSLPGWSDTLSRSAWIMFSRLGGMPGARTLFSQAHSLPPATYGFVRPSGTSPTLSRYWRLRFGRKVSINLGAATDEYEDILTDAVRLRLRADVPVALTFSGGVDSGTIAAIAARRLNRELRCYTIDYHTDDDPSEETIIAGRVASHLGLPWEHIQYLYARDLLPELSRAYKHFDQPSNQLALVYSHRLYRAIQPFAKVVLSGNGADELFCGYTGNETARQRDLGRRAGRALAFLARAPLPARLKQAISIASRRRSGISDVYSSWTVPSAELDDDVNQEVAIAARELAEEIRDSETDGFVDLLMYTGLRFGGAEGNFRLPDITGLAAQVEVRSPFLDYRMVEFAARLPHQFKAATPDSPQGNKFLPRRYYARYVQDGIADATKKGMGANLSWHRLIAFDAEYERAFATAYDFADAAGAGFIRYREAWQRYIRDMQAGIAFPETAGVMMAGFLLASWLKIRAEDRSEGASSDIRWAA
jgi:asparagine synthase (glutamine-hydrolysing)